MPRLFLLLVALLAILPTAPVSAQATRDAVIDVQATVQQVPPQITLGWRPASYPVTLQKVFRRLKDEPVWQDLATLQNSDLSHIDTAVQAGVNYEYFVYRTFSASPPGTASGYLSAGIRLPLVAQRGRAILLVDETVAASLAAELSQFANDLVGDGWIVARQDVSRVASVPAIKTIVQTLYDAAPADTRALILFGHVPVPYSGDLAPDGHPDHRGAWPADVYYGDLDGAWTDTVVNTVTAHRFENRNVPGDGKFDQSRLPSALELEVGRIDLAGMSTAGAGAGEVDLLRQYLNRDRAFRHQTGAYASIPRRGLIADSFGYFNGEAFASSGYRNFSAFFGNGPAAVTEGVWFNVLQTNSYLCAYGCGPGSYGSAFGIGVSEDFGTKDSRAVFNMLFGSYFGDWDIAGNFLRAPLAGLPGSLGLVSIWAGRPHWHLYDMAMGETVGYGARVSQQNTGFANGGYVLGFGAIGVQMALMGDPTLRLHPVAPASGLAVDSASGKPVLTWTASPESGLEGYGIWRADSAAGPFAQIGGSLVVGNVYTDRTGTPGQSYSYQVRAVKLETSAGGTYLNSSQGVFGAGTFAVLAAAEINLTGNAQPIPSGDTSASAGNGTDFGSAELIGPTVTHTFSIANGGAASLNLTGSPVVAISGPASADFQVVAHPANVLAGSTSVAFQIVFTPSALGVRTATVTIASDDADEPTFTFALLGTGLPPSPEIDVIPAALSAVLAPGASTISPVTIANTGLGPLHHAVSTSLAASSFRDSDSFGGPSYDWIEISDTGTEITNFSNSDDGISAPISLGFSFPFLGSTFTSLRVCTNGFISFTDSAVNAFPSSFPGIEAPGNLIAAFWDDLIVEPGSRIFTQLIDGLFIVQFDHLARFDALTETVTCQIVLHPSGEILLQYKKVPSGGARYAVGVQNGARTEGLRVAFLEDYAHDEFAVRIRPPGLFSWLTPGASSGTVAPAGMQMVNAQFDTVGLDPGHYFAELTVASDDFDEPRLAVPAQLTVSGPEIEMRGNGLVITAGDATPSRTDHTDFGMVGIGGSRSCTFRIHNLGADPLLLGPVAVTAGDFVVTTPPAASVAAGSRTTFVITYSPASFGAAAGAVSFTSNDGSESNLQFAIVGFGITPVQGWRLTHFNTINSAGLAADNADPDGDGLPNTLEYGLDLDPRVAGRTGEPTVSRNPAGYLEIGFTRVPANTDLTYEVEAATVVGTWTVIARSTAGGATVALGAHSVVEIGTGATRMVRVEDSQPAGLSGTRFLRVRITGN